VEILQKKAAVGLLPVRFQLIEGGSLLPSDFASRAPGQAATHWLCLQDLRKTNHRQKGYNSKWPWIVAPLFWHELHPAPGLH